MKEGAHARALDSSSESVLKASAHAHECASQSGRACSSCLSAASPESDPCRARSRKIQGATASVTGMPVHGTSVRFRALSASLSFRRPVKELRVSAWPHPPPASGPLAGGVWIRLSFPPARPLPCPLHPSPTAALFRDHLASLRPHLPRSCPFSSRARPPRHQDAGNRFPLSADRRNRRERCSLAGNGSRAPRVANCPVLPQ